MIGPCSIAPSNLSGVFYACAARTGRWRNHRARAGSAREGTRMATQHGLSRRDVCIATPDGALVRQLYECIATLPNEGTDVDGAQDTLHFLVDELLERFRPDLAVADTERHYRESPWYNDDPVSEEENLAEALEGIKRRQAIRMLRDVLREVDDA